MSFSTLVQDLTFRDHEPTHTPSTIETQSFISTAPTSVSISGGISSQLHAGYSHPLSRTWQAERQLTKVSCIPSPQKEFSSILELTFSLPSSQC